MTKLPPCPNCDEDEFYILDYPPGSGEECREPPPRLLHVRLQQRLAERQPDMDLDGHIASIASIVALAHVEAVKAVMG